MKSFGINGRGFPIGLMPFMSPTSSVQNAEFYKLQQKQTTIDWQAYHHYHKRNPEDNIPFSTPFHGSAKRKCGLFPQHHGNRVNCRCNYNFVRLA